MIAGLVAAASAQQPAILVTDRTDLQPCLDNEACDQWFRSLLSETMVQYGFMFQHDGLATSALAGKGNGFVFELHVDTAVLGPPNLVTENVRLPPILPRLEVGWQVGSFTFDDPYPQYAVSLYAFPPIDAGASGAFSIGASGSFAVPLGTHLAWAGAEIDAGYGGVWGPMVGDGDALEDVDLVAQFVDVGDPPCEGTDEGCVDRYRSFASVARAGLSVEPAPPLFLYGKLGLAWTHGSLDVAYDEARWVVKGLQPQASYGGGIRLGDRIQLAAGGVTAARPERLSTDDRRLMTRLNLAFAMRMGAARYWERAEEGTDREGALGGAP